jgi:MYXO-CTERM domain-containing protein
MILWSYQSGAMPSGIFLSGGPGSPSASLILGGMSNTPEQDSATVTVARMLTTGSLLNFQNSTATLSLDIKDTASGAMHMFTFPVVFNGTANLATHASNVTVTFPGAGPGGQSFTLGGNQYTVTIGPVQPLTWTSLGAHFPNAFMGEIDAHVSVNSGSPAATPEPSSMVLAGMGLFALAGAAWRQRRRTRPQLAV